jgi:rhamnosyltransferase
VSKPKRVTVLMRCKNSDWVIGQALEGLFSQDYQDFELLVIDSGSTDRSLELLRHYPHRLIEIAPEDYYPGKVLNMGMEASQSEIVIFQNSDGVPLAPNTLSRLVAAFDDPGVDAALSRQLVRPEADPWVRREYTESFPSRGSTPPWITLSLPMAAMRRSAWEAHPFYSDAWGSEDTEWGQWAKDNGLTIRYVADSLVMHSHNYTLKELYGRRFIEGEADAFIYRRRESLPKAVLRFCASVAKDIRDCTSSGDLRDLLRVPSRRAVYHWGYLKGHQLGARRIAQNDRDASVGQRTVLATHT